MRFRQNPRRLLFKWGAILALAAFAGPPTVKSLQTPPTRYIGTAKRLKLKDHLGIDRHPATDMIINLPGGRAFRGKAETSGNSAGFPFDTKIFGKIRKSEIRQGGGKFIISGRWTWKLNVNRVDRRAIGKFRATIVRNIDTSVVPAVFNYDINWPIRVGNTSSDPERTYVYSGRYSGKTNP